MISALRSSPLRGLREGRAIAFNYFRRLDRGPQARVERPSLNDKPLIVERRSLRSALRAPVETTDSSARDGGLGGRLRPMTPSPSYDEGTSPCRTPARGRTLSGNCGNCLWGSIPCREKASARVPPLQRQPDRQPARADEDQIDAEEDAQHVEAGIRPLGDDHRAQQDGDDARYHDPAPRLAGLAHVP